MKVIKQEVHINAYPKDVYEAYVDAEKHGEIIGSKVIFEKKKGGKFSAWDGGLSGENLELIKGKKVVQKWRADDWREGQYSTVTLEFVPDNAGTKIILTQTDVPDKHFNDVSSGWYEYYWGPMKDYFKR